MSCRHGMSNYVQRGFGYAAGWMLFQFVFGAVTAACVGLWMAPANLNPVARRIARGALIVVGIVVLISILGFLGDV